MARMKIEERKARAARRRAFQQRQPEEPPVMEHSARVAHQAKAAAGPPENKALDTGDLENKTVPELEKLAEERGVEVEGTGSGGNVLKADLLKALGG